MLRPALSRLRPPSNAVAVVAVLADVVRHTPRLGILTLLLFGVRRRNVSLVVNGTVSLAVTVVPSAIERRYDVPLRPWQRRWVPTAMLLHVIGMLGAYERIGWWDHVTHALSGSIVAGVSYVIARTTDGRSGRSSVLPQSTAAFVFGSTLGFGLLWELLEYLIHVLKDRFGIAPVLVHYGRLDTALDLVFDAVGAAFVVSFGPHLLENVVESLEGDSRAETERRGSRS